MYKNIVFDLGGVVISYEPKDYLVDKFFHEKTEKKLYDAVFGSEEWQMLDRGEITWDEASQLFLKRGEDKGLDFEMAAVIDDWTEMLTTKKATVALMKLLKKKGFNLYYLSNISQEAFASIQGRDFWKLFDGGVASYEIKMCKPEKGIYEFLLEKYSLIPQETIFTDDNRDNTSAAFEVGITGIPFKNIKNFCKMLVTYGIDVQQS